MQVCWDLEDPCTEGFECIGFRCVADCAYEGDCDLGYRCVDEQCLQSCEVTDDCTMGECRTIGGDRPGSACALTNLPNCVEDDHCGWGICSEGACLDRCDWPGACGNGMLCDWRRGEYGACVLDPNYTPPPPPPVPTTCNDAPDPDHACQQEMGIEHAICLPIGCSISWSAVLVLDITDPSQCLVDEPAPGTDLLGARFGGSNQMFFSIVEFGGGEGNEHTDLSVLTTSEPLCVEGDWVSLGCSGGAVLAPDNGPILPGWWVEIYTREAWCTATEVASADVYLCPVFPESLEHAVRSCSVYLGPASDVTLAIF